MRINYERLQKVVTELRAELNALEITVNPEKAYASLRNINKLASKEAWNIRYDVPFKG